MTKAIKFSFLFAVVATFNLLPAASRAQMGVGRPGWQAQWRKTVEAATREGRVVLSTVRGFSAYYREFQKNILE